MAQPKRSVLVFPLLLCSVLATPLPQVSNTPSTSKPLVWSVIGDSWASGVAYNRSNIYGPFDGEYFYRTKDTWGVHMANDKTWQGDDTTFNSAACGGTLMSDIKRQFKDRAGQPDNVWAMFGGNDAFFGAIVRACIFQPKLHGDWGSPWDEDPDGVGHCKKNLAKAGVYMDGEDSDHGMPRGPY